MPPRDDEGLRELIPTERLNEIGVERGVNFQSQSEIAAAFKIGQKMIKRRLAELVQPPREKSQPGAVCGPILGLPCGGFWAYWGVANAAKRLQFRGAAFPKGRPFARPGHKFSPSWECRRHPTRAD
jgi:hypothetical protein